MKNNCKFFNKEELICTNILRRKNILLVKFSPKCKLSEGKKGCAYKCVNKKKVTEI